ncbi:MAG: GNAT family N-acetyltransferase [Pseudomonadota bacterium]
MFKIRDAEAKDAKGIAAVFSPSFRLLSFLPSLHSVEEDRWFIENIILEECDVIVAEHRGSLVSFLALQGAEIRLLYVHPDFIGQGSGSLLVAAAKSRAPEGLELWCFQENARARRFYEHHGFDPVEFTDGSRNEEGAPDMRYRWRPVIGA